MAPGAARCRRRLARPITSHALFSTGRRPLLAPGRAAVVNWVRLGCLQRGGGGSSFLCRQTTRRATCAPCPNTVRQPATGTRTHLAVHTQACQPPRPHAHALSGGTCAYAMQCRSRRASTVLVFRVSTPGSTLLSPTNGAQCGQGQRCHTITHKGGGWRGQPQPPYGEHVMISTRCMQQHHLGRNMAKAPRQQYAQQHCQRVRVLPTATGPTSHPCAAAAAAYAAAAGGGAAGALSFAYRSLASPSGPCCIAATCASDACQRLMQAASGCAAVAATSAATSSSRAWTCRATRERGRGRGRGCG